MSNLTETFQKERNLRRKALIAKKALPTEVQEDDITSKDVFKFILGVIAGCTVIGCVFFTFYMLAYILAP